MRKAIVLTAVSMILGLASRADAIVVDPAYARECLKGKSLGDDWNPNTSPHCVCGQGEGDNKRINLSKPGTADVSRAVAKYGDFRDRCASLSEIKRAPKPEGKKEKSVPPPTPANIVAQLIPDSLTHDSASPASITLLVTSGAKEIAQVIMTCDEGCKVNGKTVDVGLPLFMKGKPSQTITLTSSGKDNGTVSVQFNTKSGKTVPVQPLEATVQWTTKAPPPPPTSPEKLICEGSGGTWIAETRTCVCMNDFVLRNGVCVPKPLPPPPPPPAKVVDKGTDIHPLVETLCGYGRSSSFHSGNCYIGPGLWLNITPYFDFYGMVGVGTPGATRVYTDGSPVLKSDGTPDNRHLSLVIQSGFMAHLAWLGVNAGIVRQNRGLINSVTSPTQEATSVSLGVKVLLPYDGGMFTLGPDLLVGRSQLGALDPDTEVGFTLRATWVPWNPRRRW